MLKPHLAANVSTNCLACQTELEMNFIHNYIDKIAIHFSRADFMFSGKEDNQHFGSLQITFHDNSFLTFDENGDAETIEVLIEPISFKNDLAPDIEYWKEIVLDSKPNWSDFVNTKLINFKLLQNTENQVKGCTLYFDNKKSLTYYNYFDDAKVSFEKDNLLESFVEHENLKLIEIAKLE